MFTLGLFRSVALDALETRWPFRQKIRARFKGAPRKIAANVGDVFIREGMAIHPSISSRELHLNACYSSIARLVMVLGINGFSQTVSRVRTCMRPLLTNLLRIAVENREFAKVLRIVNDLRREYNQFGGPAPHRLSKRIQNVQVTDISPRVLFSVGVRQMRCFL